MDILISFSTSVGIVLSAHTDKTIAVDVVNRSIVLWLKNKKIIVDAAIPKIFNSREINKNLPPYSSLVVNSETVLLERIYRYYYSVMHYDYRPASNASNWYWEQEGSYSNGGGGWSRSDYQGTVTSREVGQIGKPTPLGGYSESSYNNAFNSESLKSYVVSNIGISLPTWNIGINVISVRSTDGANW